MTTTDCAGKPGVKPVLPELLAPAGSLDKLKIAVHYGADAVYLSGGPYSLRSRAALSSEELAAGVAYAHRHGVKAYATVNILAHNRDLNGLPEHLDLLRQTRVDAIIVADPGVFSLARRLAPEMPIHLSTQANVTNLESARFWQAQGVRRLNLARELGLSEISEIRRAVGLELEIFVHGALCVSYSGRCALSLYLNGRDANLGQCTHPCRYRYALMEERRPGQYFPVEEDARGAYIFNSKDLCLLHRLPDLIAAGADSIKIEGRMKSAYYVGATVRLYRTALDIISRRLDQEGAEALAALSLPSAFAEELTKIGSRGYTENFLHHPPGAEDMQHQGSDYQPTHVPAGIIRRAGNPPLVEARSSILLGDGLEYLARDLKNARAVVTGMTNADGEAILRANPGALIQLATDPPLNEVAEFDLLRKEPPSTDAPEARLAGGTQNA